MGIESVIKVGRKALTQVAKKAYVKPMCKVKTLESIGLKREQLTGYVVQQSINTERSALSMSLRNQNNALYIMQKFSKVKNENILKRLRSSRFPISSTDKSKLEAYVSDLKTKGFPKELIDELEKAKTVGELQAAIVNFKYRIQTHLSKSILKCIPHNNPSSIPLEVEQMLYEATNKCNEAKRNLHLIFSKGSKEGLAKDIEEQLRKNYNINAYLGDDSAKAKQIYDAVSCAAQNGRKLPNEIIVTNYITGGEHLTWNNGNMHTMLLSSTAMDAYAKSTLKPTLTDSARQLIKDWFSKTGFNGWFSTDINAHTPLHEIMHQEHLQLLAFKTKRIPKKYRPVINSLSGYAASRPTAAHEVYTELSTKNLVSGLTLDEISLFKFLGGESLGIY